MLITWRPCGKTTTFSKWSAKSLHENPIGIFSTVSSIQNMTLVSEPTLIYAAVMLRLNIGSQRRPGIYFNRTITCGLSCTYNPWGIAHRSKPTWGSRTQLNKNKNSKIKPKRNFYVAREWLVPQNPAFQYCVCMFRANISAVFHLCLCIGTKWRTNFCKCPSTCHEGGRVKRVKELALMISPFLSTSSHSTILNPWIVITTYTS